MAIQFDIADTTSIEVEEFIDQARRVDLFDEQELCSLAPWMRRLCNNKTFIEKFIVDGLADMAGFQADNLYSSQSYILGNVTEKAFLRAAIWAPLSFGEAIDEQNFFSYERAHNHDFSLLTAGYLGPGYITTVVTLDEQPVGFIGERAQLSNPQRIQLSPGRVLLYEAGKDVHVQHPPESLSVSLNLIVDRADTFRQQLYFDLSQGTVAGYVGNTKVKRGALMRFAAALNTPRTQELVDRIARDHPCDVTRLYAFRAQGLMSDPEDARRRMAQDRSTIVRNSRPLLADGFAESHIWG